jgi:hypothetical protein
MKAKGRYSMQAWDSSDRVWRPMEKGAAPSVWRPRPGAVEAIAKCMTWTGRIFIPAMQVVDLQTGEVVWRRGDRYPDAGGRIEHPDEAIAERVARDELQAAQAAVEAQRAADERRFAALNAGDDVADVDEAPTTLF